MRWVASLTSLPKSLEHQSLDRFVAWRCNLRENHDSGDIFQTNAYASGPLIDGLLGAKVTGLLSRRAEDKIVNGYNEQKMRNGGITLNFTPDEKNDFDLDFARELQDRNSTPGMSKAAETCRGTTCTPNTKSDSRYEHTTYSLTHSGYYEDFNTTSYIQQEETNNPVAKCAPITPPSTTRTRFSSAIIR